jgi:hypothetical protein
MNENDMNLIVVVAAAVADEGRKAVDEGDGIATCLQLLQTYTHKTDDGSDRTRVLACGFILNLTNECGQ